MQSTQEFIAEKKGNFVKFMGETFGATDKAAEDLRLLDSMSITDFICYVRQYITPQAADNFDTLISGLCLSHSVELSQLDAAAVAKCRRYLELFAEVC